MKEIVRKLSMKLLVYAITCLPGFALAADPVPWITTSYSASTETTEFLYDSLFSQKLISEQHDVYNAETPGTAKLNYENGSGGYGTSISESGVNYIKMAAVAYENTPWQEIYVGASASFGGTFIGNGKNLKVTTTISPRAIVNLTVWDKTTYKTISNVSFNNKRTAVIRIPEGHEVETSIDVQISADSFNSVPPMCAECKTPEGVIKDEIYIQYDFSMVGEKE